MRPLYEINNDILSCLDGETGEILDEAALDKLQLEREIKIESVALWQKNLKAEAEMIAKEIESLKERKKAAEKTAQSLESYLKYNLDGVNFETTKVKVSFRKSERVEIDDLSLIPEEFLRIAKPEPNKLEIKKALKANPDSFLGAHLISDVSMSIK